jgi:hypothetical protein
MQWPEIRGPWSTTRVRQFLDQSVIPMRLGVQSLSGWPLVMSVWFIADGLELLGATRPDSTLVRCLERRAECGFEVAADTPPYQGVRGFAQVELDHEAGAATLDRLLVRYLGSLTSPLADRLRARSTDEVCLRFRPVSLASWDYSRRMAPRPITPADT